MCSKAPGPVTRLSTRELQKNRKGQSQNKGANRGRNTAQEMPSAHWLHSRANLGFRGSVGPWAIAIRDGKACLWSSVILNTVMISYPREGIVGETKTL